MGAKNGAGPEEDSGAVRVVCVARFRIQARLNHNGAGGVSSPQTQNAGMTQRERKKAAAIARSLRCARLYTAIAGGSRKIIFPPITAGAGAARGGKEKSRVRRRSAFKHALKFSSTFFNLVVDNFAQLWEIFSQINADEHSVNEKKQPDPRRAGGARVVPRAVGAGQ
ncbi:MAG: hypothetical protein KGL39_46385 [Patescibacteria group bacterium]|nr:hypothetical protein [Patescibacteria group bacterium]